MMKYNVELLDSFKRDFRKLDRYTQKMLRNWIDKNLAETENPRMIGKALTGNYKGKWRYRIGDYRLICMIKDTELIILALEVGHRKNIYK